MSVLTLENIDTAYNLVLVEMITGYSLIDCGIRCMDYNQLYNFSFFSHYIFLILLPVMAYILGRSYNPV